MGHHTAGGSGVAGPRRDSKKHEETRETIINTKTKAEAWA
jgi:hypothetical protein